MANINGTPGDDDLNGTPNDDVINAGDGNDRVRAGNGQDVVYAGDGRDRVEGGDGDDVIYGGDGDDSGPVTASGSGSGTGAAAARTAGTGTGGTGTGGWSGEAGLYGGKGQDEIHGGAGDDLIDGGSGDDRLFGDKGNDTIYGGKGQDYAHGGSGDDTISGDDGDDKLVGGRGDDTIDGGKGNDCIAGGDGDDVLFGGSGDDALTGGKGDDVLDGGKGKDILLGKDGDDILRGGTGDDRLYGGAGDDTLIGGTDSDSFYVGRGGGHDTVFGNNGTGAASSGSQDVLYVEGRVEVFVNGVSKGFYDPGAMISLDDHTDTGKVVLEDGTTVNFAEIDQIKVVNDVDDPKVCICFTPGTLILTPEGQRPVETLRPGDRVITRDNGIQPICWVGSRHLSAAELARAPKLRPVLIRAGALGNGMPERDMMVSPNHRMLYMSEELPLILSEYEVLVAAKHMTRTPGVERAQVPEVTYLHVMCERHEVLLANGAWTESFQPGDWSMAGIDKSQREELYALFPELREREGLQAYAASRHALKRKEAELLFG